VLSGDSNVVTGPLCMEFIKAHAKLSQNKLIPHAFGQERLLLFAYLILFVNSLAVSLLIHLVLAYI